MAIKYSITRKKYTAVIYTAITVLLLVTIALVLISDVYTRAEEEGFENLHVQTKQFKEDLVLQINSDMENLSTMARLAASLYAEGEDFHVILNSFKPIGLIKNVGILTADGEFLTKQGKVDVSDKLDFIFEASKGQSISGRVSDVTYPEREIIRMSVPILHNGLAIGVLYGLVDLKDLNERYIDLAKGLNAQLYVYESGNGKIIIDTFHEERRDNISELKTMKWQEGYTYENFAAGGNGFASFRSKSLDENLYIHYSGLGINDWQIMLARPERYVFENVNTVSSHLFKGFGLMVAIMFIYILMVFRNERKIAVSTAQGSKIRKLLLELNQQNGNIDEALEKIVNFAKSRSAFYVDTNESVYRVMSPQYKDKDLKGEDKTYFIGEILKYAAEIHSIKKTALSIIAVKANKHLVKTNPEFYTFLKNKGIKVVIFAAITDKNNRISILGTTNSIRAEYVRMLLSDIAVCFSIAIYNKNHLHKTETAATTDALTGVANRVTYKRDIMRFDAEKPENFACVFIDVNELHLHNNRYGHAAGDEMLLYIANTLKEVFYGNYIYRMGGDEFLVFCEHADKDNIKTSIEVLKERLLPKDYHVAVGTSFRTLNADTEDMVRDAEKRMYEAKAMYYQNKELKTVANDNGGEYSVIKTGIKEIDGILSVMKEHYNGIYRVSIQTDKAHRILMPSYLGYNEHEEHFSNILNKYMADAVSSEFHRALTSFLNYDAITRQLLEGGNPRITYKKVNGDVVVLTVYSLDENSTRPDDTLWVFSKA